MIPAFKFYFGHFLSILREKGCCRLYDLSRYIALSLNLTEDDVKDMTKGGRVIKHSSRVNYCAAYLKKMNLVVSYTSGAYNITERGIEVLDEFGKDLTLDDIRNLPEFIVTQVSAESKDIVYIKSHMKGDKLVSAYVCKREQLSKQNPNIEAEILSDYRSKIGNK